MRWWWCDWGGWGGVGWGGVVCVCVCVCVGGWVWVGRGGGGVTRGGQAGDTSQRVAGPKSLSLTVEYRKGLIQSCHQQLRQQLVGRGKDQHLQGQGGWGWGALHPEVGGGRRHCSAAAPAHANPVLSRPLTWPRKLYIVIQRPKRARK